MPYDTFEILRREEKGKKEKPTLAALLLGYISDASFIQSLKIVY